MLVLALVGADTRPTDPGAWPDLGLRLELLEAARDLIDEAMAGRIREARSIERIWHDLRHGGEGLGLPLATALSVIGSLPLTLTDPAPLGELGARSVVEQVGLALGRAARSRCLAAVDLVQKVFATPTEPHLAMAIVRGLGDGLAGEGCAWLTRVAWSSAFARGEWLRGAATAWQVMNARRSPGAHELFVALLSDRRLGIDRAVQLIEEALGARSPSERPELAGELAQGWFERPPAVRAGLLRSLGRLTGPQALPWLDDRSEIVLGEAFSRAAAEPPQAIEEARLLALTGHPSPTVRSGLMRTLAMVRQAPIAPALLPSSEGGQVVSLPPSILARTELDRLRAALWAGDSELVPAIVAKLDADERVAAGATLRAAVEIPDMALRRAIIDALGSLGESGFMVDAARRFRALEGSVTQALVAHQRTDQVPSLAELFDRRLKWPDDQAVDDFCRLAGAESLSYLLRAAETRFYPQARAGALRAIGRLRDRAGVFALRSRALTDAQDECRQAALNALRALGAPQPSPAEQAGFALLGGPIERLEEAVERTVGLGPGGLPGVRQALVTGSWKRRRAACAVLARLADEDSLGLLVGVLSDQDEDVRLAALEGLRKRGWRPHTPREHTLAAAAGRRLPTLAENGGVRLDVATLTLLLELGGHVFRNEVLDLLERTDGFRPTGKALAYACATRLDGGGALRVAGGLPALLATIDRTWQRVPHQARLAQALVSVPARDLVLAGADPQLGWRARQALTFALGRAGEEAGIPWLGQCLRDDDDDVRRTAMQALVEIGTGAAARALCAGFESPFRDDRKPVSQALAAMGDTSLPALEALIDDPWWEAREGAALALSMWRRDRRRAADLLIVLAVDPEYKVSQQAREGLANQGVRPGLEAVARAIGRAQTGTLEGLEPWLGLDPWGRATAPEILAALERVLNDRSDAELPNRIGMVALLRARPLLGWLEAAVADRGRHLGVRLSAADALRRLRQLACRLCEGRGALPCPECDGAGEKPCVECAGSGIVRAPCPEPDCTAGHVTRAIGSRPCETCRGRGQVLVGCSCGGGSTPCTQCHGTGRNRCPLCEGTGEPHRS
jgi:HEAT repeat protein